MFKHAFDSDTFCSGSLHEIPGDLEITDSDAPYVNSSVCIVLGRGGDHRIFISDCNIQRLPVEGLYMIQESRWNRLYRYVPVRVALLL